MLIATTRFFLTNGNCVSSSSSSISMVLLKRIEANVKPVDKNNLYNYNNNLCHHYHSNSVIHNIKMIIVIIIMIIVVKMLIIVIAVIR